MRRALSTGGWLGLALIGIAVPATAQAARSDDGADSDDEIARALSSAQVREAKGELIPAAMTLERLLAAYPNAPDARLYYASLLCKLTDTIGARAQVKMLDGLLYSPSAWTRMVAACGAIDRPASFPIRYGISGEVTGGIAYDSDVLGALAVQFTVPGFVGAAQAALSLTGTAKLAGKTKVGSGYIYANLSGRTKNDIAGRRSDYQIGEVSIGFGKGLVSAGGVARYAQIVNRRFVSEIGVQGEASVSIESGQRIVLRAEGVHQDYAGSTAQFSRNGGRFDVSVHYEAQTRSGVSWVGGAAFELKTSKVREEGYAGGRFFAGVRAPIDARGTYVNVSGTYRLSRFLGAPPRESRNDRRLLGRAAIGTPIGISGVIAEVAATYTERRFSLTTRQRGVSNFGGEARLIWKFGR